MASGTQKRPDGSTVVIIGGGIIGLSTAYFLSRARKSGRSITIVDNASILYAGASGKANGILGDYGFEPEAESLGKLSWELHRQLASLHRGRDTWGYRDVMIYGLHRVASSDTSALGSTHPPSALPTWCRDFENHARVLISSHQHAARMLVSQLATNCPRLITGSNPADFCRFLQKSCEEMGVQILLDTTITGVGMDHGSLQTVSIVYNQKRRTLECHSLVIAAGPWSETVLNGLFPDSRVRIPTSRVLSSGNYLIVKVPGWAGGQDTAVCHQIYLDGLLGQKVDISSRPDGTLYVGGSLSAQEGLPETAANVHHQPEYVHKMRRLVERVFSCSSEDVEVLEVGRAYRPFLEHGRPIVAQVPLDELLGTTHRRSFERREVGRGGVYLNVGHGCDGITLGPGSGKVMSELIEEGRSMSADISGLGIL